MKDFPLSTPTASSKSYPNPATSQQVGEDCIVNGVTMEPSGLVVQNNTKGHRLYMASDNGYMASIDVSLNNGKPRNLSNNKWDMTHNFTNDSGYRDAGQHDLECITSLPDGITMMVGVEGNGSNSYPPRIFEYNAENNNKGSIWNLDIDMSLLGNDGMEAMTFVPASDFPLNGITPFYNGYFFVGYQNITGTIYVYNLPQGTEDVQTVETILKFSLPDENGNIITMKVSDMCFVSGHLFVLFDGSGGINGDEIHVFSIPNNVNSVSEQSLTHVGGSYLPKLPRWDKKTDFEGMTIDGANMYLSVDASSGEKLVYQFRDFSINAFLGS